MDYCNLIFFIRIFEQVRANGSGILIVSLKVFVGCFFFMPLSDAGDFIRSNWSIINVKVCLYVSLLRYNC